LNIITDNREESYYLRISEHSKKDRLIPMLESDGKEKITSMNESQVNDADRDIDIKKLRRYTWKMFKHDILFKVRQLQQ
jgi:hypothetical protein